METLRCTKCGEEKPLSAFYLSVRRNRKNQTPKRRQPCKTCKKRYISAYYDQHFRRRVKVPPGHKFCPACKRVLAVQVFAPDAARHDGLQAYCRDCWPAYMQKWRATPSATQIQRAKLRRVRRTPEGNKKQRARILTFLAIEFGILVRQPCGACGNPKVEAHHTDYTKPLEVQWLCKEHHKGLGHTGDFSNPPVPVPVLAMMA